MRRIHDLLQKTSAGDYVFYSGWGLAPDVRMIGGRSDSQVYEVFKAARARGVDIRVLLSSHMTHANWPVCKLFRALRPQIECVLDARFPAIGSNHQKFAVINKGGILHAFCGGIDLAYDRWDDVAHSSSDSRQPADFPGGWHDVHCYVQGPACRDLDITFRERWDDQELPSAFEVKHGIARIQTPLPPPLPASATLDSRTHHVQVLRTYACASIARAAYPFAPRGEFTARRACLKAISLAQNYIYIEDQYFYSYEIANALNNVLRAQPQLRVIVLVPREPSADPWPASSNFHQHVVINQLINAFPTRFTIYHLRNLTPAHSTEQVYVHAKLMIIDDVWVEIGSMNCNRRSMTYDTEACVAVVDSEIEDGVCKFARKFRLELWAEHLGEAFSDPALVDPISGFNMWRSLAGKPGIPALAHSAATPGRNEGWGQVDPTGTCRGSAPIPP